ncbi:hypothetical protein FHX42_003678 [Saccharopolyspora lacisalsi]|uniref:Uncharacterized protein n=1 Tax=Halosaccharopolyspora lacisalsi TaxID=1000566 RepID=A0A839DWG8_9PSEU|nr:hypothetical protein [Halosaccharopolyspora lacisalsi]MBA8826302.1 hypothetical protein [Halosaccharopolyspora lacisalsi]
MMRHRREDTGFEPAAEAPPTDVVEQHQPTDPLDLAETGTSPAAPLEADPADAAEQDEIVAFDDELRTEGSATGSGPEGPV